MNVTTVLESLFRWTHVVAGILWIGLLYFFNWVNSAFAPTLDAEAKKKVVPELMPRALYWFRWGAAWTWATGVLLLVLVFYHGKIALEGQPPSWTAGAFVMIAVTFLAPFLYDILMKSVGKSNLKAAVGIGYVLIVGVVYLFQHWAGFSYRSTAIHTGAMLGNIMAFNVWFRIWPAQQKIIRAVKEGQAPDAALVGLAGLRSRQNTYFSIPLVWTMVNAHTTWSAGANAWIYLSAAVLLGWWVGSMLFRHAPKVKGF